jgi:hypothetical protein
MGGRKEMQADYILRAGRGRRDIVKVQVGCIGGKDRAGADAVDLTEQRRLHGHILERGFDYQAGPGEGGHVGAGGQGDLAPRHRRHLAARDGPVKAVGEQLPFLSQASING